MSAFVPEAEYRRIRDSWLKCGRFPEKWTDRQMLDACHANIQEAAKREAELRRQMDRLPPGDPRLNGDEETSPLRIQIRTAVSDQKHWREYAAHYRRKVEARRPHPAVPEREPGEDDDTPGTLGGMQEGGRP